MLGITDLPTYLLGLLLIVLLPGPNSLYVLSVSARLGHGAGYRAAAGVVCGDAVLMALAAGGVTSLLQATPLLFTAIKWAGALYLAWLALGLLRGAVDGWRSGGASVALPDAPLADAGRVAPAERPYRRALLVSLLNPKAILFFVSFFVQFVEPSYPYPALSFLALGAWAELFSITYLTVLIFGGQALSSSFRRRRRTRAALTAGVGAAFLGFAAKLAASSG